MKISPPTLLVLVLVLLALAAVVVTAPAQSPDPGDGDVESFSPSEELPADSAISFPVDI